MAGLSEATECDKSSFEIDPMQLSDAVSWLAHNPEYDYVLIGEEGAEEHIVRYFKNNTTILRIFRELKNTGMKPDPGSKRHGTVHFRTRRFSIDEDTDNHEGRC
jgi:hypothetical protein